MHDSPLILMDEPTSNLDSLNEGIILKSLREAAEKKTIVLVSHRKSTMNIADTVFEMKKRQNLMILPSFSVLFVQFDIFKYFQIFI